MKMNMKKIISLLMTLILVFSIFAGCTSNNQKNTDVQDNQKNDSVYPLTVTDTKGASVTISSKPENIISLSLGTDEILVSLVDKEKIKAVTYLSEDPGLSNIVEEAKDIEMKIGTDVEQIISLSPDLVFVADYADEKVVKQLRDANIAVYTCKTPIGVNDQKELINEIANIVGEEKKGEELIKWMDDKLLAVSKKVEALSDEDKLTAISIDSFYYAYGLDTTFDDVAKRAGVINLTSQEGLSGWQQFSKEKIIEMNPDVIFLPSWSYDGFDAEAFAEEFKNDESLQTVSAVKNNRVFCMNESHVTSVSQYVVLGVEDIAKLVYPELF